MKIAVKFIIFFVTIFFAYDSQAQNVGINTTTPAYPLDVNGRMRLQHYNGASAGLWFNDTKNKESHFIGMFNDTISGLYGTGWKIGMDGNNARIGIGTMQPTAPLSFANNLGKKISLYHGTTGDAGFGVFGNELRIHSDYVNAATTFGYDDYTNGFTEKMRLTGNGNLGIGTNNPVAKLDVAGNVRIADGTQGAGKILTSDANGNASWKSQAYGNTERFMYRVFFSNVVETNGIKTLTKDYNYGSTIASIGENTHGTDLYLLFPRAGMYHLDVTARTEVNDNFSVSGDPSSFYLNILKGINGGIVDVNYSSTFTPYIFEQVIGVDYSYAVIVRTIEVYIPANTGIFIELSMPYLPIRTTKKLTVIGHLISE